MSRNTLQIWAAALALGLILGAAALADWPSYREYSPIIISSPWRHVLAVGAGAVLASLTSDGRRCVLGSAAIAWVAVLVPTTATAVTALLLDMGAVLGVLVLSTVRMALVHWLFLFLFTALGVGLSLFVQALRE